MKVAEYDKFVHRTDQSKGRSLGERKSIALYGLVGEIGSVVSAVKKKILAESGDAAWDAPSEEIKEELGDSLWYCYALAHVVNAGPFDILSNDIHLLQQEIGASDERAAEIRAVLNPSSRDAFLTAAGKFPPTPDYSFNDYQILAFKTARTDGRILLEVCLALLTQLAAELLRSTLPSIELSLNKNVADRPFNTILGEVTWHLAAIASLYRLALDEVVDFNTQKVRFRADRGGPTPLHDEGRPPREQLPRTFEISFVRIGKDRSRMYFEGRRLGDDLTDNANEDDGYRFHDVLHLALIAHLGWSPVIRGMMRRKRPDIDQVEDGGRAKVVEELVLKAIHSEGERLSKTSGRCVIDGQVRLFPERSSIPFSLLKTVRVWVEGLEVWKNAYWEWEDAIFDGCEIFYQLRKHKQGTVRVDLLARRVTFSPLVNARVSGTMVALGMATANLRDAEHILSAREIAGARVTNRVLETAAAKRALLQALNLPLVAKDQLDIELPTEKDVSVRASDHAQQQIWATGAVDFRVAFAASDQDSVLCTVLAIADSATQDR